MIVVERNHAAIAVIHSTKGNSH